MGFKCKYLLNFQGTWSNRYDGCVSGVSDSCWVYNSFSHPVPVINGQLQVRNMIYNSPTNNVKPFVVSTSFTDQVDTIVYDLRAAYNCSTLKTLQRTNIYTRTIGQQSVVVKDVVAYTSPTKFEVGISTPKAGVWTQLTKTNYEMTGTINVNGVVVNVSVGTTSLFTVKKNTPVEGYTRLGVVIATPSLGETVTVTYST